MPLNGNKALLRVLSMHWGFSLGGVGKYAALIDTVTNHAPVKIHTVCILGQTWQCDLPTLAKIHPIKITIKSRADISLIWKIRREIERIRPDLLMTHGFNCHFVALLTRLLRIHNLPVICSYHGAYHATTRGRKLLERPFNTITEYFIRHHALSVATVAEYTKNSLIEKGVHSAKIKVIHNGIDLSKPRRGARKILRSAWGIQDSDVLIGVVSRLDPFKGISYLIEALAKLAAQLPQLKLAIVGTGNQDNALKRQVSLFHLREKVIFTGFRSDVDDCLAAFDIFVLPSLAESHSIALLEAMRSEKCIVATDVGGNTESVRNGREAFIVPPKDVDALIHALQALASNPALRLALGRAARRRFLDEFTVEVMVCRTAEWLLQCGYIANKRIQSSLRKAIFH